MFGKWSNSSTILDLGTSPVLGLLVSSRHSRVLKGTTETHRQQGNIIMLLLFFRIIEVDKEGHV
jgi:hypothetical protein